MSRFSLTLLHSPAVGKVGKSRWGHPLVEFVIVVKICRKKKEELYKVVKRLRNWCMCNRCIVADLSCNCEACSLDAPGVVSPDTAPDISKPN